MEFIEQLTADYVCPDHINGRFIHAHGPITDAMRNKCLRMSQLIEDKTNTQRPTPGDVVILQGVSSINGPVEYQNGHVSDEHYSEPNLDFCTQPSQPFVGFTNNGTGVYYSTSGGYWGQLPPPQCVYHGWKTKLFWTWGNRPCADGGIVFKARVSIWKYRNDDVIY